LTHCHCLAERAFYAIVVIEVNFLVFSGILGKRTRFQQKDISQLVLQVMAADGDKAVEMVEHGHEECNLLKVEEDLLPKVQY